MATKTPTYTPRGLSVEVRNNNIDKAIRLLSRKVKTEGIVRELRARQAFEKPSDKRRRKKAEAIRRCHKAARQAAERA